MKHKSQTAVDWLYWQLKSKPYLTEAELNNVFRQARAMERQQHEGTFSSAQADMMRGSIGNPCLYQSAPDYFDKTYEKFIHDIFKNSYQAVLKCLNVERRKVKINPEYELTDGDRSYQPNFSINVKEGAEVAFGKVFYYKESGDVMCEIKIIFYSGEENIIDVFIKFND